MGTTALELAVLAHLEHADLICAQLARRTGSSERAVQRLLDHLVSGELVDAKPDEQEPTSYHLTHRGAARLMRLRGFSEEQAAADWKHAAARRGEVLTRADEQPTSSANRAAVEHAVMRHLEHSSLTRDELAQRTETSIGVLRPALDALVAWECVAVRLNDGRPDAYVLTPAGRSRLMFIRSILATPDGAAGKFVFVALQQQRRPTQEPPSVSPPRPVDQVPRVPAWRRIRSWARRRTN
ncbi:hypothetical protein GCM10009745_24000 [Kribbella yunnanensis]|uniref:O-methyltransferase dimerisation domain-containing protein n=1 Tax=Kribbella yunnanensis TaxID=190194 RepID=A0ABN2GZD0_9ACTN